MNYLMIIRRPQWKGEDLFGGMSFAWLATVHICLAFLHSCLAVTTVHSFALLHIGFSSQLLLLTAAFIHSCLADHSLQFCFSFQCFPSQLLFFITVAFPRHSAFLHRCFSSSQLLGRPQFTVTSQRDPSVCSVLHPVRSGNLLRNP